ncbi:hypothetical protein [Flavobacterium columnare]|uniref:hypothetical protein n=1 Tax=Flavobacterium columnare TaxID=996 RepID=UPI000D1A9A31|nr:hypothetical protein [Flavobacterium columnare]PTD14374.1 hypothetical protein C6N29_07955 [Flavobacterium columnare]
MKSENQQNQEFEAKLKEFFTLEIPKKDFAKYVRHLNFMVMTASLKEGNSILLQEEVANYTFWLNELAEILDPYLKAEEN